MVLISTKTTRPECFDGDYRTIQQPFRRSIFFVVLLISRRRRARGPLVARINLLRARAHVKKKKKNAIIYFCFLYIYTSTHFLRYTYTGHGILYARTGCFFFPRFFTPAHARNRRRA